MKQRHSEVDKQSDCKLTLTGVFVSCQLIPRVTSTSVATQCVQTALLAITIVRSGALIHL